MSGIPPCAPPVPPLPGIMTSYGTSRRVTPQDSKNVHPLEEVRRLCKMLPDRLPHGSLATRGPYTLWSNMQPVKGMLQEGPTCGQVAIAMTTAVEGYHGLSPGEVLSVARDRGYSLQGELFSAKQVCGLAREVTGKMWEVVQGREQMMLSIVEALLAGGLALVPYDRDTNHEPCLKRGHKAHWALLHGLVLVGDNYYKRKWATHHGYGDQKVPYVLHSSEEIRVTVSDVFANFQTWDIYVYAKQGKSVQTKLWCLDQLLDSNENLIEVNPRLESEIDRYVFCDGGLKAGLCAQAVVWDRKLTAFSAAL